MVVSGGAIRSSWLPRGELQSWLDHVGAHDNADNSYLANGGVVETGDCKPWQPWLLVCCNRHSLCDRGEMEMEDPCHGTNIHSVVTVAAPTSRTECQLPAHSVNIDGSRELAHTHNEVAVGKMVVASSSLPTGAFLSALRPPKGHRSKLGLQPRQ